MNNIINLTYNNISNRKTKKFDFMIYNNFIDIINYPDLLHNYDEINKLLNSPDVQVLLYIVDKKLVGYLVGNIIILNDMRKVFFIQYIYISQKNRSKGIGNLLLNYVFEKSKQVDLNGIMLVCDTHNKQVFDWYSRHGFMLDMYLRNYKKHDVMYKPLN